ncbi:ComF family protein [Thermosulfurimonas marina]|uniref:ComF family protein n=1 Tax=Thermosulfurimonas marina TaxID=2047767 RepID=A0A6H1WR03_9BACT|nr:ComF family protein [Thermosulfurimonas marina]QJA05589.1 ComF family protein [Thermosulfurimonas marina]
MNSWLWWLKTLRRAVEAFFFPVRCLACGQWTEKGPVCKDCYEKLPWNRKSCPVCARPYPPEVPPHPCGDCLQPRAFDRVIAPLRYEPPVSEWLQGLKFREDFVLARDLAVLLKEALAKEGPFDLVIPVPLSPKRRRTRGFNQAALLARWAFGGFEEILARRRETLPQSELPARERRRNVRGAFGLRKPQDLSGKHILLVDDIFTTGATAEECARVLKRAGALRVTVAVVARA